MSDELKESENAEATPSEERLRERIQEELRRLTVGDYLVYVLQSLSALALRRMGLNAETQPERDLTQARLAVDAFKAVLEVLEPTRPAEERSIHRGMLAQLQLAYVEAVQAKDQKQP